MISAIISKDMRALSRSGVFLALACAVLALLIGASALSAQRLATFERERHAAEHADQTAWEGQGERNPHSAAHFSRYAFKPVPGLAAFDPGVTDYAGLAVWMEAHYQNPAVFRRAEDLGDAGQFANLSPAWVLQTIAPLFLFLILFGAVAGEREDGTLRQMASTGLRPSALLMGKLAGACAAVGVVTIPALLLSLWAASASSGGALPDPLLRALGLIGVYALYFMALGGLALGVSAMAKDRRTALLILVGIWAVCFVLVPRLAGGVAATLHPEQEAATLRAQLSDVNGAFGKDTAYQEKVKADILAEYGVDSVDELPVNYVGYRLQQSEEYADPLFDAFYAGINDVHARQQSVLNAFSLLSPVLALDALSAGLAGSDRLHQIDFTQAAEGHRRMIIKQLNNDYFLNGSKVPGPYAAGAELWAQVPNLSYTAPAFSKLAGSYSVNLLVLLVFAALAIGFAARMVRRAQERVAA